MSLTTGTRIGPFEVTAQIGVGGMGEVYRATDTNLKRAVAIKVLPEAVATDAERLARFQREAEVLARLNHPNIAQIHGLEKSAGIQALVMELVEGPTLADRIAQGPMRREVALPIARQIAEALEAAHEQGIIHRDLKPANVKVRPDGTVKVLDFGLAKATERGDSPGVSRLPTMAAPVTEAWTVMGTAPYMSPEQARGQPVDGRTDIWAFGCVLYEMLTGRSAFGGETVSDAIACVLQREPDWHVAPVSTSPSLRRLLQRCLAKNPDARASEIGEVRRELGAMSAAEGATSGSRARRAQTAALAAASLLVVLAGWYLYASRVRIPTATTPTAGLPDKVGSLAVLPLEDLKPDPEQAYFSDGMTEALVTRAAGIPGLRVVPRSAVMKYREHRPTSDVIARELNVDAILEGTILRSGDQVRITVHLINPRANHELWGQSYERNLRDVLELQSDVALAIASELRLTLTASDRARVVSRSRSVNPAAYDLYLRGVTSLERMNKADTQAAIAALEQAVALDPGFADAFGALATAYVQLGASFAPEELSRLEPKARATIDRALALDPDTADAYAARGTLIWRAAYGWPHEDAAQAYLKAIALKPTFEHARRSVATIYAHVGLTKQALRELAALGDSPATLFQKGLARRVGGDIEQALALWRSIPPESRNATHLGHIVWALSDLGRSEEAWALLREADAAATVDVNGMLAASRALLHAVAVERQPALRWIKAAIARASSTTESHHATYLVAAAYAKLGSSTESLRWLRYTASNGFPCHPLMASDHNLDSLRAHAPFVEFLNESKLRWDGYLARIGG